MASDIILVSGTTLAGIGMITLAALHGWVCYCAPIHSADGRQLGVLDLVALDQGGHGHRTAVDGDHRLGGGIDCGGPVDRRVVLGARPGGEAS